MGPPEALGWASSLILVFTVTRQVYKQWKTGTSAGVSMWLFVGQVTGSAGFTVYSWFLHNWIYVVTNALIVVNALAGLGILIVHRRRGAKAVRVPASSARTRASPLLRARA